MKSNFVVSVYKKNWIRGAKKLFIAEPYIHHVLEKNNKLKNYESIEIASFLRKSREELIEDHEFIDHKYHKYIPLLVDRLNKLHNTNHDVFFWKKCLGLSFIRYITLFYDMFKVCETSFSTDKHECKILSEQSYHMPLEFNEQRDFFQCTAYGQEQLFSLYIRNFYPDCFVEVDDAFRWPDSSSYKKKEEENSIWQRFARVTLKKIIIKFVRKFLNSRSPKIGVVQSFFSAKNFDDLLLKSKGLIQQIQIKADFSYESKPDWVKRELLSAANDDFDRFDQFFFSAIKYCFPKVFIEEFEQVYNYYETQFSKYKKMTHVVNESWIGGTYSAFAMAVIQKMGMKHIYNEHNFLSHHFLCNNHKYIFPLVDEFVSLGWYKENTPKLIKGGSLREWVEEEKYIKEHEILFVSGQPAVKPPEVSASYGDFGAFNAKSHLDFNYSFFQALEESTLSTVVYRGYPLDSLAVYYLDPHMFAYDQEYVLKEFLLKVKLIDNSSPSAKILMQKSKLIVIDYLSTSYIESMLANIPTIFFWNQDVYPLEKEYSDFYEILISVGICQTDSFNAAVFIENIKNDPAEWWEQTDVQEAKNKFLANNFGNINALKEYLIDKTAI
ncbi:MAG: putative transferase (TIGR04331 family) [Psychroserpens sp.]